MELQYAQLPHTPATSPRLTEAEFNARGRGLLAPHGLGQVFDEAVHSMRGHINSCAYFHNPHVVFTLRLDDTPPANLGGEMGRLWNAARKPEQAFSPGVITQSGGVHEGYAEHIEAYVDVATQSSSFGLHERGHSFRIRVSRDVAGCTSDIRVLLVFTSSPFGTGIRTESLAQQWQDLTACRGSQLAALSSVREDVVANGGIPSIAECFVMFSSSWDAATRTLERVVTKAAASGAHVVLRSRKQTLRTTLQPWRQNCVTGVMHPAWAYAVLDNVQLELGPALKRAPHQRTAMWRSFEQVEIEVGPHISQLRAAVALLADTRRRLQELGVNTHQVYGRKYHRLLDAAIASRCGHI